MSNISDLYSVAATEFLLEASVLTERARIRVLSAMRILQDELVREIAQFDLTTVTNNRDRRVQRLIDKYRELVDSAFEGAALRLSKDLGNMSIQVHRDTVDAMNEVFTVKFFKQSRTKKELRGRIDELLVLGALIKDYWDEYKQNLVRRLSRQTRVSANSNASTDDLISAIRGRATGRQELVELASGRVVKRPGYHGGVLGSSKNELSKLVDNAANTTINDTMTLTHSDNADTLKGWQALTVLDNRTSLICISRTGAAWDLEGNPIPGSAAKEPFPGPPPWHVRCRSRVTGLYDSWDNIYAKFSGRKRGQLNKIDNDTRDKFDGEVASEIKTGDDFLRQKGDKWAREKLGATRFELWKAGKLSATDFLNEYGQVKAVRDLKRGV